MENAIGADAAKLAGLQMEFLKRVRQGKITLEVFEAFIRGELVRKTDGAPVVKKRPKPGTMSWGDAQAYLYEIAGLQTEYESFCSQQSITGSPDLWALIMISGLTYQKVAKLYRAVRVKLESPDDLKHIDPEKEQRDPNRDGSYAIMVKATQEADEENANQSADERKMKNLQDITLLERLFLGLIYFLVGGKHLDEQNYTLCAGSRSRDGSVPSAGWFASVRCVYVHWWYLSTSFASLRARSVRSRQPEVG